VKRIIPRWPNVPKKIRCSRKTPRRLQRCCHRLRKKEGKACDALRKRTPEPVFGIIKSVLGFRQFLLRGPDKVRGDRSLVTTAWNIKRMFPPDISELSQTVPFSRRFGACVRSAAVVVRMAEASTANSAFRSPVGGRDAGPQDPPPNIPKLTPTARRDNPGYRK
jgi:hypothetical protein